jgi:hypothetical protein
LANGIKLAKRFGIIRFNRESALKVEKPAPDKGTGFSLQMTLETTHWQKLAMGRLILLSGMLNQFRQKLLRPAILLQRSQQF